MILMANDPAQEVGLSVNYRRYKQPSTDPKACFGYTRNCYQDIKDIQVGS